MESCFSNNTRLTEKESFSVYYLHVIIHRNLLSHTHRFRHGRERHGVVNWTRRATRGDKKGAKDEAKTGRNLMATVIKSLKS